jgi:ATP-dependent DNA ligase
MSAPSALAAALGVTEARAADLLQRAGGDPSRATELWFTGKGGHVIIDLTEEDDVVPTAAASPAPSPHKAVVGKGRPQSSKGSGGSTLLTGWLSGSSPARPSSSSSPAHSVVVTGAPAASPSSASSSSSSSSSSPARSGTLFSSSSSSSSSSSLTPSPTYRPVDTPIYTFDPVLHACWAATPPPPTTTTTTTTTTTITTPPPPPLPPFPAAPYLHLARACALIEPVTGRIRIACMLVNTFRVLLASSPDDVLPALLLLTGSLGPSWAATSRGLADASAATTSAAAAATLASAAAAASSSAASSSSSTPEPLSLGGATLSAALQSVYGVSKAHLSRLYATHGDIGNVAESCAASLRLLVRPQPLTLRGVLASLHEIAGHHGVGAAKKKQGVVERLLRSARECEPRYVARTVVQNLRVGVNLTTALQCLARAVAFNEATGAVRCAAAALPPASSSSSSAAASDAPPAPKRRAGAAASSSASSSSSSSPADASDLSDVPSHVIAAMDAAAETAKRAFAERPDLARLVLALVFGGGVRGLERAGVARPGTPLRPMLAKITQGIEEVLDKFAGRRFAAEMKYDGQRGQIHYETGVEEGDGGAAGAAGAAASSTSSSSSRVHIFSRHLDETTDKWPDLVREVRSVARAGRAPPRSWLEAMLSAAAEPPVDGPVVPLLPALTEPLSAFVLDAEVVAVEVEEEEDERTGRRVTGVRILPFQTLATRARTDVDSRSVGIRALIVAFDLTHLNGVALTALPLGMRRALLRACFPAVPGRFAFAQSIDVVAPPLRGTDGDEEGGGNNDDDDDDDVVILPDGGGASSSSSSAPVPAPAEPVQAATDVASLSSQAAAQLLLERVPSASAAAFPAPPLLRGGFAHVRSVLFAFLQAALAGSCEGLMCKLLDAPPPVVAQGASSSSSSSSSSAKPAAGTGAGKRKRGGQAGAGNAAASSSSSSLVATYQPNVRSNAWLKVKKDYVAELADTLDVVPIGGWWGSGRKAGWFSPILVAVLDPESGQFQSLCRVMSGFTDDRYKELTAFYSRPENRLEPAAARAAYSTGESPPHWFKPLRVWEVKGADLTVSPVHAAAAGLVHESRGISLRFPRFVREREAADKAPEDATTAPEVADLYAAQSRKTVVGAVRGRRAAAGAAAAAAAAGAATGASSTSSSSSSAAAARSDDDAEEEDGEEAGAGADESGSDAGPLLPSFLDGEEEGDGEGGEGERKA